MDDKLFAELLKGVQEMDEIVQGKRKPSRVYVFEEPDVKAIRQKTRLSQQSFAALIGVSKRTLENWEQGRRHPTGPARTLLRILDRDPEHALKALHAA
jgi:putative transcriptional regulator